MNKLRYLIAVSSVALLLAACDDTPEYRPARNFDGDAKAVAGMFLTAEDSTEITLPEGHFLFDRSLILEGRKHVTVRGAGTKRTVISFKGQAEGAEGILVKNCKHITLEGFSIEDAAGDNIKVTDTEKITFRNIESGWTGPVGPENGAYGLYPVLCKGVLIEGCTVYGASDAGIYVGQSDSVVVRQNKAFHNVAGIESENSTRVRIHNNEAYENTGGLLIFDLPGLTMSGGDVEVWDNNIVNNNLDNFAPAGNIVGMVPAGTGIMILATRGVRIHHNNIDDHKTIGTAIVSYELVEALSAESEAAEATVGSTAEINASYRSDTAYNAYPGRIVIEDNHYRKIRGLPDMNHDIGKLLVMKFPLNRPQIVWDGIRHPDYYLPDGSVNPDYRICIREKLLFVDLDLGNDMENLTKRPDELRCKN